MSTINVSLPDNLKKQAENLVDSGYYSSFSDVVRTALRGLVANSEYDLLAREAKEDYKNGNTTVLKTDNDIDSYFKNL